MLTSRSEPFPTNQGPSPVQVTFDEGGYLHIDRTLPLLCVHDTESGRAGRVDTLSRLTRVAPNHALLRGRAAIRAARPQIETHLSKALQEFGGCALVETRWCPSPTPPQDGSRLTLLVHEPEGSSAAREAVAAFESALQQSEASAHPVSVEWAQPISSDFMKEVELARLTRMTLEFAADADSLAEDGLLVRELTDQLHPALNEMAFRLVRKSVQTALESPAALGRRYLDGHTFAVERILSEIANSFDVLLTLTPANGEEAFVRFVAEHCERKPDLLYRPINFDPSLLRRRLYDLRIEDVDDPTVARLLREQREHLDDQLGMIEHRNTPKCLYESLKVYGRVEDKLHRLACGIGEAFAGEQQPDRELSVGAAEFRNLVLDEFAYYKQRDPRFDARVEIRSDVSALTVSKGTLLIPTHTRLDERRAQALLAHEVGTHLLTYHNAKVQPLSLIGVGLAGYDQFQEGLAVLAEYLAAGLTKQRLHLLAARVVAVRRLLEGAEFVEVFRELHRGMGLAQRPAFFVTMRVFRGGGFTKDASYLRGVVEVLDFLGRGGRLELLLLGKFASAHIGLVQELLGRGILKPPTLLPRVLDGAEGQRRLTALLTERHNVLDLCRTEAS